jgi:3-oxoacyl-[acyl-carrier protein] reductase
LSFLIFYNDSSSTCIRGDPLLHPPRFHAHQLDYWATHQERNMSHLKGKIAVVTGASKGIGAGVAKELGAQGASVVVNYSSDKSGADKVVAEIRAQGSKAIAVGGDVSKPEEVTPLFDEAANEFGRVDILVNNAGIYAHSPAESFDIEAFYRTFGVNVGGFLLCTKAALPLFPAEGGSIINMSSVVAEIAPPQMAIYAGTKGAINTITHVLAKELAPRKIRVNAVSPGAVHTEGFETQGFLGSPMADFMVQSTPLGRLGQPKDVADLVAYLASAEAGWVTGSIIDAAGGWR